MILTGSHIKKNVYDGKLHIYPFCEENLNPNSYNYHIDNILLEVLDSPIDPKKQCTYRRIDLDDTGYILQPKTLYLAHTYEEIGSEYYVTSLIGRSSLGRLGLFLQITADLGNIGAKHRWTLELTCVQPLKIYPRMQIGQVSFWDIAGARADMYIGKYEKYSRAQGSEMYSEFMDVS